MRQILNYNIKIRHDWSYKPTQEPDKEWVQTTLDPYIIGENA